MSKYDSDKFSDFFNSESSDRYEKQQAIHKPEARPTGQVNNQKNAEEAKIRKKLRKSKRLGIFISIIQLILTVVFMTMLYKVRANVLDSLITFEYYIGIGVVLALLFIITLTMQFKRLLAKRIGKIISVLVIIVLAVGMYFMAPLMNETLSGEGKNKITSKPFAVYLSGVDNFELSKTSNSRSDTNIIAVVNPETYTAVLISTPRDAYVELIGDDIPSGCYDKLTHAGNFGTGKLNENGNWGYGCDVSMNILSDLYGVEVDNYLRLNFTGFSELIDELGGVTIDIPQGFSTYTYGKHYTFNEGTQTLTGDEALTYVRERKSFATGDIQRGANQVAVINAIIDQAMTPNTIANYSNIVNTISDSFDSNLDLSSLAKLQLDLMNNEDYTGWNILSYSVSGTSYSSYQYCYSAERNLSVVDLDDEDVEIARTIAEKVFNGEKVTKKTITKLEKAAEESSAE